MRAFVIQHAACETPGVYERVLRERGWSLTRAQPDAGEPLPGRIAFDALIVMGGPMGAGDRAEHPWLVAEMALIAQTARSGVPVWAVCLGAQLLAASLGARIYAGAKPEVGVCPVNLTPAARSDPVFAGLPTLLPTLQWHREGMELPAEALLLARSALYPIQAFRVGSLAYGLQFHLEASAQMACEWLALPAYRGSLEQALGADGAELLARQLDRDAEQILAHGRAAFGRWLELAEACRR